MEKLKNLKHQSFEEINVNLTNKDEEKPLTMWLSDSLLDSLVREGYLTCKPTGNILGNITLDFQDIITYTTIHHNFLMCPIKDVYRVINNLEITKANDLSTYYTGKTLSNKKHSLDRLKDSLI